MREKVLKFVGIGSQRGTGWVCGCWLTLTGCTPPGQWCVMPLTLLLHCQHFGVSGHHVHTGTLDIWAVSGEVMCTGNTGDGVHG